jgi:hypothetical protein
LLSKVALTNLRIRGRNHGLDEKCRFTRKNESRRQKLDNYQPNEPADATIAEEIALRFRMKAIALL